MTERELFETLREKLMYLAEEHGLMDKEINVNCRALTPEEAIGLQEKKDVPILMGKEVMIQAESDGGIGQAFTSAPSYFEGTLRDVLNLDIIDNDSDRSVFVASLNAVSRRCGVCDRSIHCKDKGPIECAEKAVVFLKENYRDDIRIVQIGYQPFLLEQLSQNYSNLRVLDLNLDNVGDIRYGVEVMDGIKDYDETVAWAELILCTGSTLSNGTIVNFLELDKDVLFYGTTAAGAAALMGWKRLCYAD